MPYPPMLVQPMKDEVTRLGGDVLGGVTIRRDKLVEGVDDFVDRLLDAVAPAG